MVIGDEGGHWHLEIQLDPAAPLALGEQDLAVEIIPERYSLPLQFGRGRFVIVAIGVDSGGFKYVLGLREGCSENSQVATDLLNDLVDRGIRPDRLLLFVIDGSKALRCAINAVYGPKNPVQRCRNHKIRNVLGYLPDDQKDQVKCAMQAAFLLDANKGIKKLKQLAKWLEREYPSAASSLLEGLDEMFTINRLGLPKALRRCLGSTNVFSDRTYLISNVCQAAGLFTMPQYQNLARPTTLNNDFRLN